MQTSKVLSEEALQISVKRREAKSKGEKERYTHLNAECCAICVLSHLSHVQLFATPWIVAHWLLCPWGSPGKNAGVGCHFLLQGIFLTQGSNPHLLNAGKFFTTEPPGKSVEVVVHIHNGILLIRKNEHI